MGLLMVVNVIKQSYFKEIQRNGILSQQMILTRPGSGFITSKYTSICPKELLERINKAKVSFIQTDHNLRKNKLLVQLLNNKFKNNDKLDKLLDEISEYIKVENPETDKTKNQHIQN